MRKCAIGKMLSVFCVHVGFWSGVLFSEASVKGKGSRVDLRQGTLEVKCF